ncbi:MAG: type-F conjugative transfer system pilin assembly protein TrbC [Candidatus Nitrosotenuis sp.]
MLKLVEKDKKLIGNTYRFIVLLLLFLITSIAQAKNFYQSTMLLSSNYQLSAMPDQFDQQQGKVLIFVSASMSQTSLNQWFEQARLIDASIILRGFVHNSLQETREWLKPIIEQQKNYQGGIEINPVAFESYGITQVPAVVVAAGKVQCISNDNCLIPAYDVIFGNMTLEKALKIISEKGESGSLIAKQKLMQLKGENV